MCVARCLVPLVVHGHVCGKVPRSLGRSWACCVARCLVPIGILTVWLAMTLALPASHAFFPWSFMDGHVCGKVPCSLGRSWACVWQGASFPWSFMDGHVCGKMPCSHRYPDCVACHDLALPASHAFFPWSFMDGHVCGKGPSFLGRSWPCVWQGASFHWSFMDGHVCGKGPRSLGRSWASVWQGA
jgi:hypothetical protein